MKKGTKHTKEAIEKQKKSHKGAIAWNKGLSKETDDRVKSYAKTLAERGIKPSFEGRNHSIETKIKISKVQTGKPRLYQRGEKSHRWKGGKTPELIKIRNSIEYKLWRKSIYERDKYMCIWCKKIGCRLNADHIKPFSLFPELRFAIDNGRTLCVDCHRKTDTWGGKSRQKYEK